MSGWEVWQSLARRYADAGDDLKISIGTFSDVPPDQLSPFHLPEFSAVLCVSLGDVRRWAEGPAVQESGPSNQRVQDVLVQTIKKDPHI